MPDYVYKALFVLTGLMLLYLMTTLLLRTKRAAVRALLEQRLACTMAGTIKDLNGIERVVLVTPQPPGARRTAPPEQ
mgnify:CR=1 FL=1